MIFRQATSADIPAVVLLYEEAKGTPFCVWDENYPTVTHATEDLSHGGLYVLEDGGAVIGCISLEHENSMLLSFWEKEGRELARLAVSGSRRGEGLAAYMMRAMIREMRGKTPALHLAVESRHLPAIASYQKAGYRVQGELNLGEHRYYFMEYLLEDDDEDRT